MFTLFNNSTKNNKTSYENEDYINKTTENKSYFLNNLEENNQINLNNDRDLIKIKPNIVHPLLHFLIIILCLLFGFILITLEILLLHEQKYRISYGIGIWSGTLSILTSGANMLFLLTQSNAFALFTIVLNSNSGLINLFACISNLIQTFSIDINKESEKVYVKSMAISVINIIEFIFLFCCFILGYMALYSLKTQKY